MSLWDSITFGFGAKVGAFFADLGLAILFVLLIAAFMGLFSWLEKRNKK